MTSSTLQGIHSLRAQAENLAKHGRYEDTYIVHAAEGETVIPAAVLDSNPELRNSLFDQMRKMDLDPYQYMVGNSLNSVNPATGQPEFFFKKIFKKVKDAFESSAPVIGAVAGSFIPGLGAVAGPALGSFAASKLAGYDTKDALIGAGLSGLGGYMLSGTQAANAGGYTGGNNFLGVGGDGPSLGSALYSGASQEGLGSLFSKAQAAEAAAAQSASAAAPNAAQAVTNEAVQSATQAAPAATASAEGASGPLSGIWNWVKENPALAVGGGATLLAMMGDEETPAEENMADLSQFSTTGQDMLNSGAVRRTRRDGFFPSGRDYSYDAPLQYSGGGMVKDYSGGGGVYGPGNSRSDSIPARLSDGEFVMTADAVRGAGEGDRLRGAARMLKMMKKFEGRA